MSVDDAIAKYNATHNTPHRLYIRDYTPEEIRALPAGPLLTWLTFQAMGASVSVTPQKAQAYDKNIGTFGYWRHSKADPWIVDCYDYSSDPALVGPMMQRLGYADIDFSCNSSGHGVFACQRRSDPDSAIDVGGTSDPHALAVALVLAVRQQEGTANDSGT